MQIFSEREQKSRLPRLIGLSMLVKDCFRWVHITLVPLEEAYISLM